MWTDIENPNEDKKASEFKNKTIRIYVTNAHIDHKPEWIIHCRKLGIETMRIPVVTGKNGLEDAKQEAMRLIRHLLCEILASLPD